MSAYTTEPDGRFSASATMIVYYSQKDGTFSAQGAVAGVPGDFRLSAVHGVGDFNGDGGLDLLIGPADAQGNIDGSLRYLMSNRYDCSGACTLVDFENGPNLSSQSGWGVHAVGDFDGDGKDDVLQGAADEWARFGTAGPWLYTAAPNVAGLLNRASNRLGGSVDLFYTPSSLFSNTSLPFVLQTVGRIVVNDGLGGSDATDYEYSQGLFDSATGEFRGFASAVANLSNGARTGTDFYQDRWRFGRQKRQWLDVPQSGGGMYVARRTNYTWLAVPHPLGDTAFVKLSVERTEHFDSGSTPSAFAQTETVHNDTTGFVESVKMTGTGAPAVFTRFTYVNTAAWQWRVASEVLEEPSVQGGMATVRSTRYAYDATGNLRYRYRLHDEGQAEYIDQYTYDVFGNQRQIVNARGFATTMDYDTSTKTHIVKTTSPSTNGVAHVTEEGRDILGRLQWSLDENAQLTTYLYDDPFMRLTRIDYPDGGAMTYAYSPEGEAPSWVEEKKKISASGEWIETRNYSDGIGRDIQQSQKKGASRYAMTTTVYNAADNSITKYGPFFATTAAHTNAPAGVPMTIVKNDHLGRAFSAETLDGQHGLLVTQAQHTGFSTTTIDADGKRMTEVKDFLGRVTEVIKYESGSPLTTTYTSNAAGDILEIVNVLGHTVENTYDLLGRKVRTNDPDMGVWRYGYDEAGNLTSQLDSKSQLTKIEFDGLNRPTLKSFWTYTYKQYDTSTGAAVPGGSPGACRTVIPLATLSMMIPLDCGAPSNGENCEYGQIDCDGLEANGCEVDSWSPPSWCAVSWMPAENPVVYSYDQSPMNGVGRLHRIDRGNVATVYDAYDAMGAHTQVSKTIQANTYTTSYAYDLIGRTTQVIDANDFRSDYAYRANSSELEVVRGGYGSMAPSVECSFSNYNADGEVGRVACNNGTETTRTYDALSGRLKRITTSGPLGEVLLDKSYSHTASGDVDMTDDRALNITYTYAYDDLHRLLGESSGGAFDPMSMQYDAIGRIVTRNLSGRSKAYAYQAGRSARLSTVTQDGVQYGFEYDANGNMTHGPDFSDPNGVAPRWIEYGAENMPAAVHRGFETTSFLYDGDGRRAFKSTSSGGSVYYVNSRYEEVNASGRSYLFAKGMRLAMVDGNGAQFLHSDQLGSANVSTDELGQIISGTEYTPFGVVRSKFGNKVCAYGFTDQEYDAGTGLYNYDARLYDPVLAIFIMADTLIPDILNPQSFNRYAYALNSPLVFVDPSGHISINAIKIIAGVAQITLGGIACWTGVGCAAGLFAIANGVDDIYSGVRGLQKGDSNATGFIEDFGNVVGEGVGLGPGVGGLSLKMATALVGATAGAGIGGTASFAIPGAGVGSGGAFALVLWETSVTTGSVASTAAGIVSMAGPWMNQYSEGGYRQKTRGANRNDRKMVDDAARKAGIQDRGGFGKFVHRAKDAEGRGPSDNFTWKELLELALKFKASGGG